MHSPNPSPRRRAAALSVAAGSLLSFCAGRAAAETASLEPVVVTGARIEQPLDDALAPVTLITRADLERLQAAEVVELIARQAGLQFARSGGPGSQASLFARGANSGQLLVLVDGQRINAATSGAATLGGLDAATIERIEIVRGNLSSLYGSEAIGGVVQIFTRGADGADQVTLAGEGGSGGTVGGSASATRSFGDTRVSATVGGRRSAPFSAIDAAQVVPDPPYGPIGSNPDRDGNRNLSGALRLTQRFGAGTTLGLSAWTQRNRTDFDSAYDGADATHDEDARLQSWRATLRQALGDVWTLSAQAGQVDDKSDSRSSAPYSYSAGRFESRNRDAQLTLDGRLAERVTAQIGGEYLDQRGGATSYDPTFSNVFTRFDRDVASAWFGVTGRTAGEGRQQLQLNVRHDDYSDAGGATTWLAAYGYALTPALRATLQLSTAFRAPSFNDLYYPYYGNPGLRPERARSEEAGLRYAQGGLRASLSVFRTRTRDLIQYDSSTYLAGNVARARMRGVELAAGFVQGPWRIEGNANWLSTEDESTGERLLRRAPRHFNLGLFHDQGQWRLGTEASWVAARDDSDLNTSARKTLASYTLLRAVAEWRVSTQLAFTLRVENLLDEKYALVDGYNTWGRAVFGGLRWGI